MKTLADALTEILCRVPELGSETIPLRRSLGQATAEDVLSEYDLPMLDLCGPDGYAVRSIDVTGASPQNPVVLQILGTNRAGYLPTQTVERGCTVRVMTGSPVPSGADCVVPFESTDEPGDKSGPGPGNPSHVAIFRPRDYRCNIRPTGSNVRRGSVVVPRGTCIGPAQISALTSVGVSEVKVTRRPRVAIMSTGDELVRAGRPLKPGQSYDSNSPALAALVAHCGALPRSYGIARDSERSLTKKFHACLAASPETDAIVTSGGVSKGDFDLVRLVIDKIGHVIFSRISMGPGASFAFGLVDRHASEDSKTTVPVFAVAGPTVGCLINFETLVRPALFKMMGCATPGHMTIEAVATGSVIDEKPMDFVKWTHLYEAHGEHHVDLTLSDRLGHTAAMATANSLTIIPKGTRVVERDRVSVRPLDWTQW